MKYQYVGRVRWRSLAVLLVLAFAYGCGGASSSRSPPQLTVHGAGPPVTLSPFSYCWGDTCADGAPREPLPDAGRADQLRVELSEIGLTFTAELRQSGRPCARTHTVRLGETATHFTIWPAGPAGTYDVNLFADGGPGRSVSYAFRWTTTRNGVWPIPAASAAVVADNHGAVEGSEVEVGLENLAKTPGSAAGSLTVTSADGRRTAIRLTRLSPSEGCLSDGSVRFRGTTADGSRAAASGSPPFRYDVTLVLDGRTYRGTGTWPDDQIADFHPYVALRFSPALPALPR